VFGISTNSNIKHKEKLILKIGTCKLWSRKLKSYHLKCWVLKLTGHNIIFQCINLAYQLIQKFILIKFAQVIKPLFRLSTWLGNQNNFNY